MKRIVQLFKRPPFLLSGAILALFGLGRLWATDWSILSHVLTGLGLILWFSYLSYWVRHWRKWVEVMQNPTFASSFATFPMASLLLSHYLHQWAGLASLAQGLWWLSFASHLALVVYFTVTFVKKRWYHQVMPSWTVLYVGLAMVGVTSQVSNQQFLGSCIFYFGLVASLVLYPPLTRRLVKRDLPRALLPQKAILCAPLSLLIVAGQTTGVFQNSASYLFVFLLVSQGLYLYVVLGLRFLLSQEFSPAFSAMTFPLVISATALKMGLNSLHVSLPCLVVGEMLLATGVLFYVLWQFFRTSGG